MKKIKENIPVNIEDMINKLLDNKTPNHIRDNYMNTLSDIKTVCEEAINSYNKKHMMKRFG